MSAAASIIPEQQPPGRRLILDVVAGLSCLCLDAVGDGLEAIDGIAGFGDDLQS